MELVRTITRQGFELESPNSHRMCILGPFRTLLKMGSIDLDLQGHFGLKLTNFCKFELGRTITHPGFELESPYWLRMCILGPSIEKGVNWPWPSRSFTSNVYITISQERVDRLTSDENFWSMGYREDDHWVIDLELVLLLIYLRYWLLGPRGIYIGYRCSYCNVLLVSRIRQWLPSIVELLLLEFGMYGTAINQIKSSLFTHKLYNTWDYIRDIIWLWEGQPEKPGGFSSLNYINATTNNIEYAQQHPDHIWHASHPMIHV